MTVIRKVLSTNRHAQKISPLHSRNASVRHRYGRRIEHVAEVRGVRAAAAKGGPFVFWRYEIRVGGEFEEGESKRYGLDFGAGDVHGEGFEGTRTGGREGLKEVKLGGVADWRILGKIVVSMPLVM